jgi:hypothetical protein
MTKRYGIDYTYIPTLSIRERKSKKRHETEIGAQYYYCIPEIPPTGVRDPSFRFGRNRLRDAKVRKVKIGKTGTCSY